MARARAHRLDRPQSVAAFRAWLVKMGAELLAPTNPYEVVRFRSGAGLSVVYRCERTRQNSMTNQAKPAWEAFKRDRVLDLAPAVPPPPRPPVSDRVILRFAAKTPLTIARLQRRDQRGIRDASLRLFGLERAGRLVRSSGGPGRALTWRLAEEIEHAG